MFTEYKLFRKTGTTKINENDSNNLNLKITTDSSSPEGYDDITTTAPIQIWMNACDVEKRDYKFKRRIIQTIFGMFSDKDFNSYTEGMKYFICSYKAMPLNICLQILGGDANMHMDEFNTNSIKCREIRMSKAMTLLINNISASDCFVVLKLRLEPNNLIYNYIQYGVEGTFDGDPVEGIFNYILSTPLSAYGGTTTDPLGHALGKYETIGLSASHLTMLPTSSLTKEQLVDKLIDCLKWGVY